MTRYPTPAERHLVIALCERAAECWADGNEEQAERWATAALALLDAKAMDFLDVDPDDEVAR